MKKNLFYLFALICSMSLFTACSDDDEDTSWMVYQEPTEFTEAKLQVITNGTEQQNFPVTFTATSANTGTLTFEKIVNVAIDFKMDVNLKKTTDGYEILGTKEKEPGYAVNVKGNVTSDKMYLEVTTTGYATINKNYSSGTLVYKRNGVEVDMTNSAITIDLKATAADKIDVTLNSGAIPGVFVNDDGFDAGYVMKGLTLSKEADKEVYSFSGESQYGDSKITVEGSVAENKILTLSANVKIESPIVGKWSVKMDGELADVIAVVTTPEQKITMPEDVYKYVPAELRPMITQTMTDKQIMGLAKNYLGQYVTYLKSIEFKADGNIDIIYTNIGDPTEHTFSGLLNYVVKDDKLQLAPNIAALIGSMMPTNTKAYDPNTLLNGGPIPLNFTVNGDVLSVSVDETVIGPLVSFVNQLLPLIGMFMPDLDPALLEMIGNIVTFVDKTITPTDEEGNPIGVGAKLEVGLMLTK
ncbi:hypothetical protein [uncultured Bacteroides sp.]|uniref:hypothetical protein n=1 Tax=uncultured Bacteroides sp. TaxID=162156 RepID=UPI0025D9281E|nr:hypothetical protein [uncultured Bacteroides sp.]